MKISLNWIKDFVDIDPSIATQELVQTITLSVCEVEGFEEIGNHLADVVAAEVMAIEDHPDAEKLTLVTVDTGKGTERVVCGASNFKTGDIVPYAGIGVVLPGNFKIKKVKIRGVESSGMLCAEDELGFSDDHSGLMILDRDTPIGSSLADLFPDQVDVVMEIDNKSITHRPDLWGHYGFARELGAIYRVPVKPMRLDRDVITGTGDKLIEVDVIAKDLVPRFTGLSVDNIRIVESPAWIRHRLTRVGLRPINNMVDLTNYVMLELGQPMHAFDAERIAGGRLIVKLAKKGTRIMTLHQKEVELDENDMTICDVEESLVVAGVVGGKGTGVSNDTRKIFLEAANWNPVGIRKTSTRIGLRTDASKRFEKSLDPEMSLLAIQRAVELMKLGIPELKVCGEPVDIYSIRNEPITIEVDTDFICRRLGKAIDNEEIIDILQHLGFSVEADGNRLSVGVPSHRRTKDVSIAEDLVEEIGRIHGFNNIPARIPVFPVDQPVFNQLNRFVYLAKSVLSASRYHEAVNYPLTCQKTEDLFGIKGDGTMRLKNPVADHQNQMRTSMLPHFMQSILDNQKLTREFRLFEFGRIYYKDENDRLEEPRKLIMGVSMLKTEPGAAFFQLKSDICNLFSKLKIGAVEWKPLAEDRKKVYQHTYISADITVSGTSLGTIYSMTPEYTDKLGLKEDVCVAELHFDRMFLVPKQEYLYHDPPKYPAVNFELSIMMPRTEYFRDIQEIIRSVDNLVKKVEFSDVFYPGEHPGQKSLSVSIEFRSAEKTLDSDEARALQDKVIDVLAEKGYSLRESQ